MSNRACDTSTSEAGGPETGTSRPGSTGQHRASPSPPAAPPTHRPDSGEPGRGRQGRTPWVALIGPRTRPSSRQGGDVRLSVPLARWPSCLSGARTPAAGGDWAEDVSVRAERRSPGPSRHARSMAESPFQLGGASGVQLSEQRGPPAGVGRVPCASVPPSRGSGLAPVSA